MAMSDTEAFVLKRDVENRERAWFPPPKAAEERVIFTSKIFRAGENFAVPRSTMPRLSHEPQHILLLQRKIFILELLRDMCYFITCYELHCACKEIQASDFR